jgi:hypothetical protein
MRKLTCRQLDGPCDEVFKGETAMEISDKGGAHVMTTTDDAHKEAREMMKFKDKDKKASENFKNWKKKVLLPAWNAAKEM